MDLNLNKKEIKKIPNFPGIYLIINTINGKKYVGKSLYIRDRLYRHILKEDPNKVLYKAFNKYGIENFKVRILYQDKNATEDYLFQLEIKYIEEFETYTKGYNMTKGGEGVSGYKYSEEEKEKMRQRYLDNSSLLKQSKECKCITYCCDLNSFNIIKFDSRREASQYLISVGYKSSDTQIVKAIKNKTKHHNHIFANTKDELEILITNFRNSNNRSKINYDKFYDILVPYADQFGILPTIEQLAVILKMSKTSVSRRVKILQERNKLRKINILDQHRIQLSSSLYDQSFFHTGTILTNISTGSIQFIYDNPNITILGYKIRTIKEKRRNKQIINGIRLEIGCLYYLSNALGIDSVTSIWKTFKNNDT